MQSKHWIVWNIFLAVIPVVIGYAIGIGAQAMTAKRHRVPWLAWALPMVVWFAFIPNTCYLITEWRHFLFDPSLAPIRDWAEVSRLGQLEVARWGLWYLIYSGAGVLCFGLAIRPIAHLIQRAGWSSALLGVPFFLLTSLGVYMGLIERLNSWDVMRSPHRVLDVAVHALTTPLLLRIVVVFAVLLWLLYLIVDIWVDGFMARVQGRSQASARRRK